MANPRSASTVSESPCMVQLVQQHSTVCHGHHGDDIQQTEFFCCHQSMVWVQYPSRFTWQAYTSATSSVLNLLLPAGSFHASHAKKSRRGFTFHNRIISMSIVNLFIHLVFKRLAKISARKPCCQKQRTVETSAYFLCFGFRSRLVTP